jgi:hypothetical protein
LYDGRINLTSSSFRKHEPCELIIPILLNTRFSISSNVPRRLLENEILEYTDPERKRHRIERINANYLYPYAKFIDINAPDTPLKPNISRVDFIIKDLGGQEIS